MHMIADLMVQRCTGHVLIWYAERYALMIGRQLYQHGSNWDEMVCGVAECGWLAKLSKSLHRNVAIIGVFC